ncbi:MAG: GIY-YIG nuclease family protein [Paracoccaceae bacterium]
MSIILHLTKLEPLRSLLPVIADHHPDLFDAYQSVHSVNAAATLSNRRFAASFVPIGPAQMVFAGLFEITDRQDRPVEAIYSDPRFTRLEQNFGATDTAPARNIARGGLQRQFTMTARPELTREIGRLRIAAPGTRAYVQIAANLDPDVIALTERRHLSPPVPHWTAITLSKPEILSLSPDWAVAMAQWRGIYLITDIADGARYVGSAYGSENIIGRWRIHVAGEHGVTRELRPRRTANFRFSILDLLLHDQIAEDVIRREHSWMDRLHTRTWGLNR